MLSGRPDEELFVWAQQRQAVIITFDEDFADQRHSPLAPTQGSFDFESGPPPSKKPKTPLNDCSRKFPIRNLRGRSSLSTAKPFVSDGVSEPADAVQRYFTTPQSHPRGGTSGSLLDFALPAPALFRAHPLPNCYGNTPRGLDSATHTRACKINCVTGYHASSIEDGGFDDQARHENGCVVG
jgi:Domain of unknown function (DUF5615)